MSRPLRIQYPNAWYHVMNRGRRGDTIFNAKEDYRRFIDILLEAIELFSLRVSAYCLMTNHYHLVAQTPDANLSRCMRHINGVYTQRFNAAHGLDGPLFRGRYKAMLVGEGSYLLQLIRYVHKNPVRAGKVESVEQYEWSSHRGYLSAAKKWDWLHKRFILSMIAKDPKQRIKRYRMFMAEDESESFLQTMNLKRLPSVLGENQFLKMIKERYFERKRHVEVPESKGLAPETDQIIAAVCRLYGIDTRRLFHAKRGNLNEARSMAIYLCRYLRGESLAGIGKAFDISSYSTVSSIIERFKVRMQSDRKLLKKVEAARETFMRQGKT
jgi:REP element-mobilizing transposase RayT